MSSWFNITFSLVSVYNMYGTKTKPQQSRYSDLALRNIEPAQERAIQPQYLMDTGIPPFDLRAFNARTKHFKLNNRHAQIYYLDGGLVVCKTFVVFSVYYSSLFVNSSKHTVGTMTESLVREESQLAFISACFILFLFFVFCFFFVFMLLLPQAKILSE